MRGHYAIWTVLVLFLAATGTLLSRLAARANWPEPQMPCFFGTIAAQAGLFVSWIVFAHARWLPKAIASIIVALYFCGIIAVGTRTIVPSSDLLALLILYVGASLYLACASLVMAKGAMRLSIVQASEVPPLRPVVRWSIRQLLGLTTLVALLLGAGRLRAMLAIDRGITLPEIYVLVVIMAWFVHVPVLWATLSPGPPIMRSAIMIFLATLAGLLPLLYFGTTYQTFRRPVDPEQVVSAWMALFCCHAVVATFSLLLVRAFGWRVIVAPQRTLPGESKGDN